MSDDDIDERTEDVSDIILQIGKDALPDLNYLATNGSCNMYVNDWAQELIFKVWVSKVKKNKKHSIILDFWNIPKKIKIY